MSTKEQMRAAMTRNRSQAKLRQESTLGRAAETIGLSVKDATEHNWQLHLS